MRTHARKIWIKGARRCCRAYLWDILFFNSTYVHTPTSNSPGNYPNKLPTPPPLPHNPTLIKYQGNMDEYDNTTTRSDEIPDPCHTSIHDPCAIGCIGNLLAEKWWPDHRILLPRFSELAAKLDHPWWRCPKTPEQFIAYCSSFLSWNGRCLSGRSFFLKMFTWL